ncbi:carbon storage regulator CsrA [bacterium]|nr:carbon storage regulator CsrA [bacterium]
MLVLSRFVDESIQIGSEVTITLLEIKGKQAIIGVQAPSDVSVHREEIYIRLMREQCQSGRSDCKVKI